MCRPENDSHEYQFQDLPKRPLSETVVRAVAKAKNIELLSLPPLAHEVESSTLDTLVLSSPEDLSERELEFCYCECQIVVEHSKIVIDPASKPARE